MKRRRRKRRREGRRRTYKVRLEIIKQLKHFQQELRKETVLRLKVVRRNTTLKSDLNYKLLELLQ